MESGSVRPRNAVYDDLITSLSLDWLSVKKQCPSFLKSKFDANI